MSLLSKRKIDLLLYKTLWKLLVWNRERQMLEIEDIKSGGWRRWSMRFRRQRHRRQLPSARAVTPDDVCKSSKYSPRGAAFVLARPWIRIMQRLRDEHVSWVGKAIKKQHSKVFKRRRDSAAEGVFGKRCSCATWNALRAVYRIIGRSWDTGWA